MEKPNWKFKEITNKGYVIQHRRFKTFYAQNENGDWCFEENPRLATVYIEESDAARMVKRLYDEEYEVKEIKSSFEFEIVG